MILLSQRNAACGEVGQLISQPGHTLAESLEADLEGIATIADGGANLPDLVDWEGPTACGALT
jgi:hypothetical protein